MQPLTTLLSVTPVVRCGSADEIEQSSAMLDAATGEFGGVESNPLCLHRQA